MKKLLILALVLMLTVCLAACGNKDKDENSSENNSSVTNTEQKENDKNNPQTNPPVDEDLSKKPASEGLVFELNEDNASYTMIGIGTCRDKDIVIPATYNGLPVTTIMRTFSFTEGEEDEVAEIFNAMAAIERVFIPHTVTSFVEDSSSASGIYWIYAVIYGYDHFIPNLRSIQVDENNSVYSSIDGNLYSKDGKTLIKYAYAKKNTSFEIPSTVTKVSREALSDAIHLVTLTIGENVTEFGSLNLENHNPNTNNNPIIGGDNVVVEGSNNDFFVEKFPINTDVMIGHVTILQVASLLSNFYSVQKVSTLVEIFNKSALNVNNNNLSQMGLSSNVLNIYTATDGVKKTFETNDGFLFYQDGETSYLMGYTGRNTKITLPESCNGKKYEIYPYAFCGNDFITDVTIPSALNNISEYAFAICESLTSVTINDGVSTISNGAFAGCSLVNVYIPKSVSSIALGALDCSTIKNINVDSENIYYSSIDGNLYSKDKKTLISYASGKEDTSFTIPSGVTDIEKYAFYGSENLTKILIPDSIMFIGLDAFLECTNLTYNEYENAIYLGNENNPYLVLCAVKDTEIESIIINDKTKVISYCALAGCHYITDLVIPEGVVAICEQAVYSDALQNLVIPDSVIKIGKYAFADCRNIEFITIGKNVTSIDKEAFAYCENIFEIYNRSALTISTKFESIPDADLGIDAFNVYSDNENSKIFETEDGFVFYDDDTRTYLIKYKGNTSELVLPESFNGKQYEIYTNAFYNNEIITKVTISSGVSSIMEDAFYSCENLETVIFASYINQIYYSAFDSCDKLKTVVLPAYVGYIDANAFWGCSNLEYNIYDNGFYLGNEENPYLALIKTDVSASSYIRIHKDTEIIADGALNRNISIIITDDNATEIRQSLFEFCRYNVKGIVIGKNVSYIGYGAFESCNSLENIYYNGTKEEWDNIYVDEYNARLESCVIYYYCDINNDYPTESGNYWYYDEYGNVSTFTVHHPDIV